MRRRLLILLFLLLAAGLFGGAWMVKNGRIPADTLPGPLQTLFEENGASALLELQGNVEIREVRLGFEISGRITRMLVEEGDEVEPGQVLARVDPKYFEAAARQAQAALAAREAELLRLENGSRREEIQHARANAEVARVTLRNAEKEFERAQRLFGTGAVSEDEFDQARTVRDQAEAQLRAAEATRRLMEAGARDEDIAQARAMVEQARAQLDEARDRLADAALIAPSAGIIQTRVHEPGDFVGMGESVYTISIADPVWVRAYVDEEDLGRVRSGMEAEVHTDGGAVCLGRIGFISPVAEFTPKTVETQKLRTDLVYRVRVVTPDPERALRQGMPVTVILRTGETTEP